MKDEEAFLNKLLIRLRYANVQASRAYNLNLRAHVHNANPYKVYWNTCAILYKLIKRHLINLNYDRNTTRYRKLMNQNKK